jgi:hypothetical protein
MMNRGKQGAAKMISSVPLDGEGDDSDMKVAAAPSKTSMREAKKAEESMRPSTSVYEVQDGNSDVLFGDQDEAGPEIVLPCGGGAVGESTVSLNDSPADSRYIKNPQDTDVLFGRGRPYQSHPGNLNLHRLVAIHKSIYERSRRFDKLAIADQIVFEINSGRGATAPGRFLRRVERGDYWEEAPHEICREKVAHALRGHIKQAKLANKTPKERTAPRESSSTSTVTLPVRMQMPTDARRVKSTQCSATSLTQHYHAPTNPQPGGLAEFLPPPSALRVLNPTSSLAASIRMLQQPQQWQQPTCMLPQMGLNLVSSAAVESSSIDQLQTLLCDQQQMLQLKQLLQQSRNANSQAAEQAEQHWRLHQEFLLQLLQQSNNVSPLGAFVAERQQKQQLLSQLLLQSNTDNSLSALLEQQQHQQRLLQLWRQPDGRNQLSSLWRNFPNSATAIPSQHSPNLSAGIPQLQEAAVAGFVGSGTNEALRIFLAGELQNLQMQRSLRDATSMTEQDRKSDSG